MGQNITLYRVAPADFAVIEQENSWETMQRLAVADVGFDGSFMALEFMLEEAGLLAELANAAIYPPQVLAPSNEFEEGSFDLNDEEDADALLTYFSERITYATPDICQLIWEKLQRVPVAEISRLYDSQKLNAADIYPSCWHDDESENKALNRRHLTEDYAALCQFYAAASKAGEYVVSVGVG